MPGLGVPAPAQVMSADRSVLVPGIRPNRPVRPAGFPGLAAVIPIRVLQKALSGTELAASADFDGAKGMFTGSALKSAIRTAQL